MMGIARFTMRPRVVGIKRLLATWDAQLAEVALGRRIVIRPRQGQGAELAPVHPRGRQRVLMRHKPGPQRRTAARW